ncbi:MAG: CPBP family intramembrane metalloprotease [Bryobacteraceae bacterium]|nr:CPBP family intramembrane metalloprotease [Bryobacteraceae bacterium]MDW8376538.1 CPBP family intramembrane glutamic endopeptidase [Bryobacterales bacterium]
MRHSRYTIAGLRSYFGTVAVLWVLGAGLGLLYARHKEFSLSWTVAVLPALLLEIALYAAAGFPSVLAWLQGLTGKTSLLLVLSAVAPYLVLSLALGTFEVRHLATLATLASGAVFWRRLLPKHPVSDLLFLAFAASVYASKTFTVIYENPAQRPPLDILGRLMWIRLLVSAVRLSASQTPEFGFVPAARQWRTGFFYYICALPPVLLLSFALGVVHQPAPWTLRTPLLTVATFLGFLWVVGLAEEFFFRGMLQPILEQMTGHSWAGLALTSVIFGLAHLGFRQFPNWRFALVAAICGVFYGLAYSKAKSVLAAAVTHALVVTTWRVFFV